MLNKFTMLALVALFFVFIFFKAVEAKISKTTISNVNKQLKLSGLKLGSQIFIRIFKEERQLELWIRDNSEQANGKFKLFKAYNICAYSGELGPKTKQGDYQAPEGFYFVTKSALNPNSSFHLSFNLGYPNKYDRAKGYTGDYLMVHGNCVSVGCYAMTDKYIEEIYYLAEAALNNSQSFFRVHIFPFRYTENNLNKINSQWLEVNGYTKWKSFWLNLQEGYQVFEENNIPPNVEVKNNRYIFN